MRLIDADALKEEYVKLGHCAETYAELYINTEKLIDNAQTVPLPDFKEGYKQAIIDGKTNFSRPKGEWIFKNGKYRCTACGERAIYRFSGSGSIIPTELLTDFCWKCGADMRGKEE